MKNILNYKKLPAITMILFLLGFCMTKASAQQAYDKLNSNQLAAAWLHQNCDEGEKGIIFQSIKKLATEIEPLFIKAYQQGPPAEEIREFEKNATARFESIKKALNTGQDFGLSKEELDIARNQSQADFIQSQKNGYVAGYRSRAIIALGITKGPEARKLIDVELRNEKSELNAAAKEAKKLLGQ